VSNLKGAVWSSKRIALKKTPGRKKEIRERKKKHPGGKKGEPLYMRMGLETNWLSVSEMEKKQERDENEGKGGTGGIFFLDWGWFLGGSTEIDTFTHTHDIKEKWR